MTLHSKNYIPVDMERIAMVAETDDAKSRIFSVFFDVAEELIFSMENAMRSDAYKQWKDAAHSLKGAAANLGMDVLMERCRLAEKSDGSGLAKRRWLLENIREEVRHIKQYITVHHPEIRAA